MNPILVKEFPKCDVCSREAHYDAKTYLGFWANLCPECMEALGIGIGMGVGQEYQKSCSFQPSRVPIHWTIVLLIGFCGLFSGCAQAKTPVLTSSTAILAIIGEAEGEGYKGMLAIADAIRNRHNLHGVYGLYSPRVRHHLYSQKTYNLARKAWLESLHDDITDGASGWGNNSDLAKFKQNTWWSNCVITAHIGNQWFYKETI
jgi:hypothetical protein